MQRCVNVGFYHELGHVLLPAFIGVVDSNVVDERFLGAVRLVAELALGLQLGVRLLVLQQVRLVGADETAHCARVQLTCVLTDVLVQVG